MEATTPQFLILPEDQFRAVQAQLARIEAGQARIISEAEEEILFTEEEFCRIVKCSKKTAQNWRNRGLVRFVQLGSVIRYPKDAIRELCESFSIKPTL